MKDFLFFLFKPTFWFMNYPYSKEMDRLAKRDLKLGFKRADFCCAEIGMNTYWIANYPYAYGTCFTSMRPSRRTIYEMKIAEIKFKMKEKTTREY